MRIRCEACQFGIFNCYQLFFIILDMISMGVRCLFEDSKLWDIGERGFLPAVDPCKELPEPWDQLLKVADYIPSYAVQGGP